MDAFFLPEGPDRFGATAHARGPWSPDAAHGGPAVALLARCVERAPGDPALRIVRVSAAFLRPVPLGTLTVAVGEVRASRSVDTIEARLQHDGRDVVVARFLRIRTRAGVAAPHVPAVAPPGPDAAAPFVFPVQMARVGYHSAMEVRLASGRFGSGRVAAWLRMRVALVAGEAPSPLARLLVAADATSGVSAALDFSRFVFVNPDLDVAVGRPPVGEWVGLDARTDVGPDGTAVASAVAHDTDGHVGFVTQALLVTPRP